MAGFKDIVGHKQIIEHLKSAISAGKISHAYILNGENNAGKMMFLISKVRELNYILTPGLYLFFLTDSN